MEPSTPETLTRNDLKKRLELVDRADMIEDTVARELMANSKELVTRAEQRRRE